MEVDAEVQPQQLHNGGGDVFGLDKIIKDFAYGKRIEGDLGKVKIVSPSNTELHLAVEEGSLSTVLSLLQQDNAASLLATTFPGVGSAIHVVKFCHSFNLLFLMIVPCLYSS